MNQIEFYEKHISFWNSHPRLAVRDKYIDYLLSFIKHKKFCRIIDIGCGCGHDALKLGREFVTRGVRYEGVAVDQSCTAIKYARSRLGELGENNHWQLEVCDFFNQTWHERFDVAVCSMVVMHYQNVDKFLKGVSNCLNNNGYLLFVINNPFLVAEEYGLLYEEGVRYSHVFKMIGDEGVEVDKFFHTMSTYYNAAVGASLRINGIEEIYDYSNEMQFFNDDSSNPYHFPNFLAMVMQKNIIEES